MIRRFTGWHMAAITISFFAVIIAVNITLAILANSSWTGLVVANSYVASQNFNRDAEEARRQQAIGWQMKLSVIRGSAQAAILDKANQPLSGLSVRAVLQRPTDEAQDQTLKLVEAGKGIYVASAAIDSGNWIADITIENNDHKLVRFVQRVFVK